MSRFVPAATVVDGLVAPQVRFFEDDLGGFRSQPTAATGPPLLPGTSGHISFDAEAWTLAKYAAELSRQTRTEVTYTDLPPDTYKGVLVGAGLPETVAGILMDVDVSGIAPGRLAGGSGDLSRLIGRPTTPLSDSIRTALAG